MVPVLMWVTQMVYKERGHSKQCPGAHALPGSLPSSPRAVCLWLPGWTRRALTVAPLAQSQDCIAAALACSKILKELSKEEEDTDSSEEMLALADQYEHRAIGESTARASRSLSTPRRPRVLAQGPSPSASL